MVVLFGNVSQNAIKSVKLSLQIFSTYFVSLSGPVQCDFMTVVRDSTYSSDRFHWSDDLHQRRLICKTHRDWSWSSTFSCGSTHEWWLPVMLKKMTCHVITKIRTAFLKTMTIGSRQMGKMFFLDILNFGSSGALYSEGVCLCVCTCMSGRGGGGGGIIYHLSKWLYIGCSRSPI